MLPQVQKWFHESNQFSIFPFSFHLKAKHNTFEKKMLTELKISHGLKYLTAVIITCRSEDKSQNIAHIRGSI